MKTHFFQIIAAMFLTGTMACSGGGGSETASEDMSESAESTAAAEEPADEPAEMSSDTPDIVALASSNDDLSTLVSAVQAAGLVETLQGDGPFTVFAPTNAAFEALPEGTLENLLKPENKQQLADILTYHVVSGEVMSTDLSDGMTAETVEGSEIEVGIDGESVTISGATVVAADVDASNGVVHVIDQVILPPSM
jgi:uncharacterized surface protein with fasciclin (FAS1) repeats